MAQTVITATKLVDVSRPASPERGFPIEGEPESLRFEFTDMVVLSVVRTELTQTARTATYLIVPIMQVRLALLTPASTDSTPEITVNGKLYGLGNLCVLLERAIVG